MIELRGDEYFMREALRLANKAVAADEVPVGAVIVRARCALARSSTLGSDALFLGAQIQQPGLQEACWISCKCQRWITNAISQLAFWETNALRFSGVSFAKNAAQVTSWIAFRQIDDE
jgi:hypothetical protein